jgi:hypothetical protein
LKEALTITSGIITKTTPDGSLLQKPFCLCFVALNKVAR